MPKREQDVRFTNGVRVVTLVDIDIQEYYEGNEKTRKVIQYLTHIGRNLGGLWTVERYNSDHSSFHLLYNGGKEAPNGITISLYNSCTWDEEKYRTRPDYWRFECSGSYPQPKDDHDWRSVENGPRATINISDPVKAASAIKSRLIPGVTQITQDERLYCEQIRVRNEGYLAWLQMLAERTGNRFDPVLSLQYHEKNFHMDCGGSIRLFRGSQTMHFAMTLQPDELELLLQFTDQVSKLRSEKQKARTCN